MATYLNTNFMGELFQVKDTVNYGSNALFHPRQCSLFSPPENMRERGTLSWNRLYTKFKHELKQNIIATNTYVVPLKYFPGPWNFFPHCACIRTPIIYPLALSFFILISSNKASAIITALIMQWPTLLPQLNQERFP